MINRLPVWFRQDIPTAAVFNKIRELTAAGIHTVCQFAHCPNIGGCFQKKQMAFMILGSQCSRQCRFCAVAKISRQNSGIDDGEPERIARQVMHLGLSFAVITSVTRDDLPDGGAQQFVRTIKAIRSSSPAAGIEVLIPDFQGNKEALKNVALTRPDIIAHNLETVPRLYPDIRGQADYHRSLNILQDIKQFDATIITKSSLLLGMGESKEEAIGVIKDLAVINCDILTLGQYLAPSDEHYPVKEFIPAQEFQHYRDIALNLGIKSVLSGPLVRSSYQAQRLYEEFINV